MKLKLESGLTGFTDENGKWICTGSQMRRRDWIPDDLDTVNKLYLQKLKFVDGDYDSGGAYWGSGTPLYCAWGESETEIVRCFVRAESRTEAKGKVREFFPNARFFN